MSECIFCQIISGTIPAYKIYEDSEFLTILDIFPKTVGHALVIPKKHVEKVWDYPEIGKYFEMVTKIAQHLKQVSGEEVRALVYGFDVPHAHVHLMPGKKDNLAGEKATVEQLAEWQKKYKMD